MSKKTVLVKRQQPQAPTKKELEDAAEDARTITSQSPIIQNAIVGMIAARRLYMVYRSMLDNELSHGWEADNQHLIVQTLEMSAQERAMINFKVVELQRSIFQCVVPTLDIIVQQEAVDERAKAAQQEETKTDDPSSTCDPGALLPGNEAGTAPGLDDVPDGAGSDPVEQAGERGEGDHGKEGQAGG